MLVLARREGESIRIGDDITITVIAIRRDHTQEVSSVKVRLAIDAPREIPVHREEIYEIIQREKAEKQKLDTEK